MKIEEGYYRCTERSYSEGLPVSATWVGPFRSALHAWDNAYANGELNERKSERERLLAYDRKGESMSISEARYIQEDVDGFESLVITVVPPPVPKYSTLLNEDGLLSL